MATMTRTFLPRIVGHLPNELASSPSHLMQTAEITPESQGLDLRAARGTWGLACVWARQEKAIAERLTRQGMSVYLPLVRERRPYRKAVIDLELAACPGYLFVAWEHDRQFADVWSTPGVFDVRRESRQALLVEQMCGMQRALASKHFRGMDRWRQDQAVQIRQGHDLAGVRGWLTKDRTSNIIQVGYPLLGSVAKVEIDAVWLELVDGTSVAA